jgi:hypothetical protein
LVDEDEGDEGTAEQEAEGTAEQTGEQATRATAVAVDGTLSGGDEGRKVRWEDVCPQVKKARGCFAKRHVPHPFRAGGSIQNGVSSTSKQILKHIPR